MNNDLKPSEGILRAAFLSLGLWVLLIALGFVVCAR